MRDESRYLTPIEHPTPAQVSEHLATRQRFAAYAGHIPPVMQTCAWCGDVIRKGREPTWHGICPECASKHFPEDSGDPGDDGPRVT